MNPVTLAARFRSRTTGALRSIFSDALYRGSLILIVNTVATSAIGFIFWSLAAHRYPASAVGVFSSVTSGAGLLAAIAALGLPNVIIRHIASAENARELMTVSVTAIATVGTTLCLAIVLVLGPHLPPALDLRERGGMVLLVTALVTFTAVSTLLDVSLMAIRSSHGVLIKNLAGSIARVVAMLLLVSFSSSGLLIAYCLGLGLTVALGGVLLDRQIRAKRVRFGSLRILRSYLSITSGNYVATIMGILPVSIVPLEVLVVRGASETGLFAVAFLIGGFLNVIPSTVAQVLFAEASRGGASLRGQARKAIRGVYGLLLPAIVIVIGAAPLVLRLFGAAYAAGATGCLRVLALSALFTGGTYLVDSLLIARDRIAAYVFMNGANAVLVLGLVGILVRRGLTAAAVGWALAQGLSLLLGLVVLAMARLGRRRKAVATQPEPKVARVLHHDRPPRSDTSPDPQIRERLAAWPGGHVLPGQGENVMTRVVVVGDLMTDAVAHAHYPLARGGDTAATVSMHGGGSGANIAAWLAVDGTDVAFVGRRGADIAGWNRDMELMGYGVDARLVMDPERPTGTRLVVITYKGEHTVLSDPGANAALSTDDLPLDLFTLGNHMHVSGYTLLSEGARPAALAAIQYSVRAGMTVSVDAASPAPLERIGAEPFLELTDGATLLFVNEAEGHVLTGRKDPEQMARILTAWYPQVVAKMGADGALFYAQGGPPVHVPAAPMDRIIDGTGAGDAFCAGFLRPWLDKKPPGEALATGCRLAAHAMSLTGARPVL